MSERSARNSTMWMTIVSLCLILASAFAFYIVFFASVNEGYKEETKQKTSLEQSKGETVKPFEVETIREALPEKDNPDIETYLAELTETLRLNHTHERGDILFHVRLKDIFDDLVSRYPNHGKVYFSQVIESVFPDFAEVIVELVGKLVLYDEWLLLNLPDLNVMEHSEQERHLWEKRLELFGKNVAATIWNQELPEAEKRYEAVQDVVALLHKSQGMEMEDRVNALLNTFERNYSAVEELLIESKGTIAQTILGLEAVQEELDGMAFEERQEQINQVRRLLGFPEEDIAYLEEQDRKWERDWNNGYAYMEERAKIESQFEGVELDDQLNALRDKYFDDRADTIKKEEEHLSFYRYTRTRIYGVN